MFCEKAVEISYQQFASKNFQRILLYWIPEIRIILKLKRNNER